MTMCMSDIMILYHLLLSLFYLYHHSRLLLFFFFFFNDTATTEIYTLSLHDALPICLFGTRSPCRRHSRSTRSRPALDTDRKSTRLNSSHLVISYAVFCLKKKKKKNKTGNS